MPLYEYHCQSCGQSQELLESMSAPLSHDCPTCGAALGMQRQVSAPAFALAGSGWAANGYAKEGKSTKGTESSSESTTKAAEKPATGCCGGCCHGHG